MFFPATLPVFSRLSLFTYMARIPTRYEMPPLLREAYETYHRKRAETLTSHQLGEYRVTPHRWRRRRGGLIEDIERPAYVLGRAAHTLILEGQQAYNDQYFVGWHKYKEQLKTWQDKLCRKMNYSVHSHPEAVKLFPDGEAEGVLRGTYCGMYCQIRIDYFSPHHGIIDLKTCEDLDSFRHWADNFGYDHQLAFYRAVAEACTGVRYSVHMIAVEKQYPYRSAVFHVSRARLAKAQIANEKAMNEMAEELRSQAVIPGPNYDQLQEL